MSDADVTLRLRRWAEDRFRASKWALSPRFQVDGAALGTLLAGLAMVGALGVGFAEIADNVLEGEGVAGIDRPASRWLAVHRDAWLTARLRVFTELGSPAALAALLALLTGGVIAARRRSWLPVMLGVVGTGGIGIMVVTIKVLVARPRPLSPFALIAADGFSFPSGHATGTAAVALLCAWMAVHWLFTSWGQRVAVWAAAIGFVGTVGFSRVYLGVHYVSDVVAGWLLGGAWAVATILVGSWWEAARHASSNHSTDGLPR